MVPGTSHQTQLSSVNSCRSLLTQLNAFLSALMIMIMDVAFILFGWNRSILQVNKTIILVDREIHKQLPAFFKKKDLVFTWRVYKILQFSLQFLWWQWLHSGGLQPGGLDKGKWAEMDSGSGRTTLTFKRIDQLVRWISLTNYSEVECITVAANCLRSPW